MRKLIKNLRIKFKTLLTKRSEISTKSTLSKKRKNLKNFGKPENPWDFYQKVLKGMFMTKHRNF